MPSTLGIVASHVVPFSPLDLSPLIWLDASDTSTITQSGGLVSEWRDKAGGSYKATQSTATNQPTTGSITQNGLNALSFGANDTMTITSLDMGAGQKWSIWAVFNATRDSTTRIVLEQTINFNNNPGAFVVFFRGGTTAGVGPNSFAAARRGSGQDPLNPANPIQQNIDSPANQSNVVHSWITTFDGTLSTNELNGYIDGTASTARVFNYNTNSSNLNANVYVGSRAGSTLFVNGPVCEIGVVLSDLTSTQRTDLQKYLKDKWATP